MDIGDNVYPATSLIAHLLPISETLCNNLETFNLSSMYCYQHVDQESKTYPIKQALSLLIQAGITYPCFHTSAQNYPLGAELK